MAKLPGLIVITFFVIVLSLYLGAHKVEEGHIGVYWRGGALLEGITTPGFHFMIPFVTTMSNVRITLQTDTVRDVPCGTSGGVMIYFDKIEVVNFLNVESAHQTIKEYGINYDKTWIFDKVHHEINQFCSSHTLQEVYIEKFSTLDEALRQRLQSDCDSWKTGIVILSIRVTKPRIPEGVRENYEEVENSKTELMIATQKQTVTIKGEETEKLKEKINAEKEAEVAKINAEQEANVAIINAKKEADVSSIRVETSILEKKGEHKRSSIDNEILLEKQKALTDASAHFIMEEAEANKLKLTEAYLQSVLYENLGKPNKVFFGESVVDLFLDWMPSSQDLLFAPIGNNKSSKIATPTPPQNTNKN